jgi:hypothetical protein
MEDGPQTIGLPLSNNADQRRGVQWAKAEGPLPNRGEYIILRANVGNPPVLRTTMQKYLEPHTKQIILLWVVIWIIVLLVAVRVALMEFLKRRE